MHFNSNMVQLKVARGAWYNTMLQKFQFQYGTIKRLVEFAKDVLEKIFQFQYGTIKSLLFLKIVISPNLFQFQYGTIKSRYF